MPPRPTVVVDPSFPDRLRALRKERDLTYRALGHLAAYSHVWLWEIETGHKQPTPEMAARLDEVLSTGGVLARLITVPSRTEPLTLDDEDRLAYVACNPRRVDPATVEDLAVMLAEQRRLEDSIGSAPLIVPVGEQLEIIGKMVWEAGGPLRRNLVDVAAQWAQFFGWLNTSIARPVVAEMWLDRALVLAAEAGNTDVQSTALSFKGHLAWTLGEVGPMIGLTEAAEHFQGVYVGQLAYDALQAARGHAVADEVAEVKASMAKAADLAEQTREYTGPVPPWHYYRTPGFFALERGRVYRYLAHRDGYARRAVDELRGGLGSLPADVRNAEWVSAYLFDLAVMLAVDGDSAEAGRVLDEVLQVAEATGAVGLAESATRLARRLDLG